MRRFDEAGDRGTVTGSRGSTRDHGTVRGGAFVAFAPRSGGVSAVTSTQGHVAALVSERQVQGVCLHSSVGGVGASAGVRPLAAETR
jgi:hypothetical protein